MNSFDVSNDNVMFDISKDELCDLNEIGQFGNDELLEECNTSLLEGSNHSLDLEKEEFWEMAGGSSNLEITADPQQEQPSMFSLSTVNDQSAHDDVDQHMAAPDICVMSGLQNEQVVHASNATFNGKMNNSDTQMNGFNKTGGPDNSFGLNLVQTQQPTMPVQQTNNNVNTYTNDNGILYKSNMATFPSTANKPVSMSLIDASMANTNNDAAAVTHIGGNVNEVASAFREENNSHMWEADHPTQRRPQQRRSSMPMSYTYSDTRYQDFEPTPMAPRVDEVQSSFNIAEHNESEFQQDPLFGQYQEQVYNEENRESFRAKRRGSMPSNFSYAPPAPAPMGDNHLRNQFQMPSAPAPVNNTQVDTNPYGYGDCAPSLASTHHQQQSATGSVEATSNRMKRRCSMPSSFSYDQPQVKFAPQQPTSDSTVSMIQQQQYLQEQQQPTVATATATATPTNINPDEMMQRLQQLMLKSEMSQKSLQHWDKKQGLPKNHSPTMVNSSRSRTQLQEGVVLTTWSGTPLTEAAKNAANKKSMKLAEQQQAKADPGVVGGGKMSRRGSCPY